MKERIPAAKAREMGLWATVLMLLAQHFLDGGLKNPHVASSIGVGLGVWAAFRYVIRPSRSRV